MSLFLQRLVLKRSPCRSCLHPLYRRAYTAAVLLHSSAGVPQEEVLSSSAGSVLEDSANAPSSSATPDNDKKKPRTKRPKKEQKTNEEVTRPNLLERTKVEDYLEHIALTKDSISLEDLEHCKPRTHGQPGTASYESAYNTLLDTLVRSFSARQLRHFVDLYNLPMFGRNTKWDYAVAIIEREWKWPSLTQIQKEQRDWSEVSYQTFPLDSRQCFLLLGKDGVDLLNLSSRYNVHISLSARPLCIKVEGLRGALDQLTEHIAQFKEDIQSEVVEVPGQREIQVDLVQRISRLSSAYVEDLGNGEVRISYRKCNARTATVAKRLLAAAVCKEAGEVTLLAYAPKPSSASILPPVYSLYPFLIPLSLPWTSTSSGLFRIRRIGDWLESQRLETPSLKSAHESIGLGDSHAGLVTLDKQHADVKSQLLRKLSGTSDKPRSSKNVVASLGHMLWSSPSRGRSLIPPLKGSWQFSKILDWIKNHGIKHVFIPGAPRPLLGSAATQQRVIHRLVYNALPEVTGSVKDPQGPMPECVNVITFEVVLGSKDYAAEESARVLNNPILEQTISLEPSCRMGAEANVDLMIPDRPMDIRFCVSDSELLSVEQWPAYLKQYYNRLEAFLSSLEAAQPDTPLLLKYDGTIYTLKSSTSVRQSFKQVLAGPNSKKAVSPFEVVSESIMDTESNEKSMSCQVTCDDLTSESSWKTFLNRVDWLTSQSIQSSTSENLSAELDNYNNLAESTVEEMLERIETGLAGSANPRRH